MEERRQHLRLPGPIVVQFLHPITRKTERSFTHDLSEAGLRFPTPVTLQIGQELVLTLELPSPHPQGSAVPVTGEVIWIREIARLGATQYDVGVRFLWIEDPDRQRLLRHLQSRGLSPV